MASFSSKRLLHKFELSHPIDRKSLRAGKAQLEQEIEALRPDVDAVQAELDELKTVRYWVRKVIPDALSSPAENGKFSLYETLEKAQNEKDIATLMEQTAKQIITSGHSEIHHKAHRQHDELQ